jgi:small nuclear ribonucleoprotein (snRNP)-like protein
LYAYLTQRIKVSGILKGYDGLVNLVMDDCREYIQGKERKRKKEKKNKQKKKLKKIADHLSG